MKFAILARSGSPTFVKAYDYFVSQGGLNQSWGKNWEVIEADSIDLARVEAIRKSGGDELYCDHCGKDMFACCSLR